MSFEKKIKILKMQLGDKLHETLIRFILKSGKEEVGIIEDLDNKYLIIQTEKGAITLFELDGFQIVENQDSELKNVLLVKSEASEEIPKKSVEPESDDFIDENSINLIHNFLKGFRIKKHHVELDIKPPDLSFPSKLFNLSRNEREKIKKNWDRISSQFLYYLKINNLSSLISLSNELIDLGTRFPSQENFLYNAGCFLYEAEEYNQALKIFVRVYKKKKKRILFLI